MFYNFEIKGVTGEDIVEMLELADKEGLTLKEVINTLKKINKENEI